MKRKIRVSGTGCCLVDRLYNHISFQSEEISLLLSRIPGDGGLVPGQLVFREELEQFAGSDLEGIMKTLTRERNPDEINVGGPSIVALIHASQMCRTESVSFSFYGSSGSDRDGHFIREILKNTEINLDHFSVNNLTTPSTVVLSDPDFEGGHGERIFINSIAGAWEYTPDKLNEDFFSSEVVVFGGTALVPRIHSNLTELLAKAKSKGCITVVNTVFDFLSEKSNPGERWPLGKDFTTYGMIDLLVMDREEAFRLSGCKDLDCSMHFFKQMGAGAVVISGGPEDVHVYSSGQLFRENNSYSMPVSEAVLRQLSEGTPGDTTGCGDNFAGGILASLVHQMSAGSELLDLTCAVKWGISSGGFSCFYLGGVFHESHPGEKLALIKPYLEAYERQWHALQ